MMMRAIWMGALGGLGITLCLAVGEALLAGGQLFGLRTGIVGVAAGGIMLAVAFLMSLTSYWLASRNRAPGLRRRLLQAAIYTGAAGMTCGFSAATLWLIAGRPWAV